MLLSDPNEPLYTFPVTLVSTHLSHALQMYRRCRGLSADEKTRRRRGQRQACAISSIIHAYAGFESFVNLIGHQAFSNADSQIYVPPTQRNLLVTRFVRAWDNNSTVEKFHFLASDIRHSPVPARLSTRLRELNLLRNWLSHGVVFTTTLLLEETRPTQTSWCYKVHDVEHSVEWAAKFPNTQFSLANDMQTKDAAIAFRVSCEAVKFLGELTLEHASIVCYDTEETHRIGFGLDVKIDDLLQTP